MVLLFAGALWHLSPRSRNREHDTGPPCPAKTPKNFSNPASGTKIVIRSSFVFPQIMSPRVPAQSEEHRWAIWQANLLSIVVTLDWTMHRQSQGGPVWLSFSFLHFSVELPCYLGFFSFGVNSLMLWYLSWHPAQLWHWNSELERKMREKESKSCNVR